MNHPTSIFQLFCGQLPGDLCGRYVDAAAKESGPMGEFRKACRYFAGRQRLFSWCSNFSQHFRLPCLYSCQYQFGYAFLYSLS